MVRPTGAVYVVLRKIRGGAGSRGWPGAWAIACHTNAIPLPTMKGSTATRKAERRCIVIRLISVMAVIASMPLCRPATCQRTYDFAQEATFSAILVKIVGIGHNALLVPAGPTIAG